MALDWSEGTIVLLLVTWVAEQKLHSRLTVNTDNLGILPITYPTARCVLIHWWFSVGLSDVSEDFKNGIVDWYL